MDVLSIKNEVEQAIAAKPAPEKVMLARAKEWHKEGKEEVNWQRLMPPRGFQVLPADGLWNAPSLG